MERLSRRAAVRAGKAVSPAGFLQVGGAGRIIGEKSLELGSRMREWEIGAVENIRGALPYIRFAPILALVGVGVNRIGKDKTFNDTIKVHESPNELSFGRALLNGPRIDHGTQCIHKIDKDCQQIIPMAC